MSTEQLYYIEESFNNISDSYKIYWKFIDQQKWLLDCISKPNSSQAQNQSKSTFKIISANQKENNSCDLDSQPLNHIQAQQNLAEIQKLHQLLLLVML